MRPRPDEGAPIVGLAYDLCASLYEHVNRGEARVAGVGEEAEALGQPQRDPQRVEAARGLGECLGLVGEPRLAAVSAASVRFPRAQRTLLGRVILDEALPLVRRQAWWTHPPGRCICFPEPVD